MVYNDRGYNDRMCNERENKLNRLEIYVDGGIQGILQKEFYA